jgi:hypothetical protein
MSRMRNPVTALRGNVKTACADEARSAHLELPEAQGPIATLSAPYHDFKTQSGRIVYALAKTLAE